MARGARQQSPCKLSRAAAAITRILVQIDGYDVADLYTLGQPQQPFHRIRLDHKHPFEESGSLIQITLLVILGSPIIVLHYSPIVPTALSTLNMCQNSFHPDDKRRACRNTHVRKAAKITRAKTTISTPALLPCAKRFVSNPNVGAAKSTNPKLTASCVADHPL